MLTPRTTAFLKSSVGFLKPRNAVSYIPSRSLMTLKDVKHTSTSIASGAGWNGDVECNGLKLKMAVPRELGGSGRGATPEQLLAMGYSTCLLGSIQAVAQNLGKEELANKAIVHTSVHLGTPTDLPGFGLAVDIKVEGVDQELLEAGHKFCPFSRALGNGIVVNASIA